MRWRLLIGMVVLGVLASACTREAAAPTGQSRRSFPEGSVNVGVELLDTGLLKGNAG